MGASHACKHLTCIAQTKWAAQKLSRNRVWFVREWQSLQDPKTATTTQRLEALGSQRHSIAIYGSME